MAQETFERVEKKYLLSSKQYTRLLAGMQEHVKADAYGNYTICNLYYDTPDYELIRTSLEKPYYKEKMRLRSYGVASPTQKVFLEIKKKCGGIVYKRRVELPLVEAQNYMTKKINPTLQSQIMNEIHWFTRRYDLAPKVYIAYDREAYAGVEDKNLRITFDRNIRCREEDLSLAHGTGGAALLGKDQVLMEIKIPESMPLWLAQLLAQEKVYPASFSKYGTFYKKKITREMDNKQEGAQKYA